MTKKKPFTIKCPATVLAIEHTASHIEQEMERIVPFLQNVRGRTLFVETYPWRLRQKVTEWMPLIEYARKRGIRRVTLLDSDLLHSKIIHGIIRLHKFLRYELQVKPTKYDQLTPIIKAYELFTIRERKWILKLRKARKGDIVVMHPDHAFRIAPLLGIPHKNIVWIDQHGKRGVTYDLKFAERWLTPRNIRELEKYRKMLHEKRRKEKQLAMAKARKSRKKKLK